MLFENFSNSIPRKLVIPVNLGKPWNSSSLLNVKVGRLERRWCLISGCIFILRLARYLHLVFSGFGRPFRKSRKQSPEWATVFCTWRSETEWQIHHTIPFWKTSWINPSVSRHLIASSLNPKTMKLLSAMNDVSFVLLPLKQLMNYLQIASNLKIAWTTRMS